MVTQSPRYALSDPFSGLGVDTLIDPLAWRISSGLIKLVPEGGNQPPAYVAGSWGDGMAQPSPVTEQGQDDGSVDPGRYLQGRTKRPASVLVREKAQRSSGFPVGVSAASLKKAAASRSALIQYCCQCEPAHKHHD